MTQDFAGIESSAPVQQASVVHHHQIARFQQEPDLKLWRTQQMIEGLARAEISRQLLRPQQRDVVQPRAEVDRLDTPRSIQLDERGAAPQLGVGVAKSKPYRRSRQNAEGIRILCTQRLGRGES